jgi:perosamine synthetase
MLPLRLPPHRLDLTMPHWLGAAAALLHRDDRRARSALERAWAPAGDGLAFLSVRSAFDCALSALDWPPGSEVLVSAVNIREMVDLLQAHGLVAVPLPLEPRTMQPLPGSLRRAVTPRTRGLLLAHLFGARADVAPLFAEARALGLICFEDAAQAFRGPDDRGDALADLAFFSFGTIKTATALGGALVRIGRPELRRRMAEIQASWPRQERRVYARKVGVALALLALQVPLVYTAFWALCRLRGTDSGAIARRLTRGFGGLGPGALLRALRHRPSAALLVVLHRRLRCFAARTAGRLEARRSWGDQVAATVDVLGAHHGIHTHWLLPVRVDDVDAALAGLRAAGIDASGPSNVVDLDPRAQLMDRLVFVPAYPELSRGARRRLLGALPARAKEPTSC